MHQKNQNPDQPERDDINPGFQDRDETAPDTEPYPQRTYEDETEAYGTQDTSDDTAPAGASAGDGAGNGHKPATRAMKQNKLRIAMLWLCAAVACASLIYIGVYVVGAIRHQQNTDEWIDIYKNARNTPDPAQNTPPAQTPGGNPGPAGQSSDTPADTPPPPTEAELLAIAEAEGRERDALLLDTNGEYWGFLKVEGLGILEPYVQTGDNSTYLNRSFAGKKSSHGTIYLDYRNHPYLTDYNNVFYGHNMNDGSMFSSLLKYKTLSNYEKAPIIEIDSLTGVTTWLVFAAYTCEPDYGYIDTWVSGEEYAGLLEEIYNRSLFHTEVDVTEDDRIITLSTCNTLEFRETRFVVHARKLRPGEELPTEFAAMKNENQKPMTVPKLKELAEIPTTGMAVMQQPRTLKMYYYHRSGNNILWYEGDTNTVQGPYTSYNGGVNDRFTSISVAARPDGKMFYMASTGLKDQKGIFGLSAKTAGSAFRLMQNEPISPYGVDARWPVLALDGSERLWLMYSVEEDGKESVYCKIATAAETTKIAEVEGRPGLRPVAMIWHGGKFMCIWREQNNGIFRAARQLADGSFALVTEKLSMDGDNERLLPYGKYTDGNLKAMKIQNGIAVTAPGYALKQGLDAPLNLPTVTETNPPVTEPPVTETAPPAETPPPPTETPAETPPPPTETPAATIPPAETPNPTPEPPVETAPPMETPADLLPPPVETANPIGDAPIPDDPLIGNG